MQLQKSNSELQEVWKDVVDFEGFYEISNLGNLRSKDKYRWGRGRKTKSFLAAKNISAPIGNAGYRRTSLSRDNYKKNIPIHRIVAIAFIPNPFNYNTVNHIDGNKLNNCVYNLEWCTCCENNRHARRCGLNVAKKGKLSHSYGFNNKHAKVLKNKITGELKPIVEILSEYPQYCRRYINQMFQGTRTNKTDYILVS